MELWMQMIPVEATHIPKFNTLEMSAGALVGIEIGRLGRQAFKVNLFGGALRQECSAFYTTLDGRAIPNHQ